MDENDFLDQLLTEVYKTDLTDEDLAKMSISEKKDYIKRVSVLLKDE